MMKANKDIASCAASSVKRGRSQQDEFNFSRELGMPSLEGESGVCRVVRREWNLERDCRRVRVLSIPPLTMIAIGIIVSQEFSLWTWRMTRHGHFWTICEYQQML